MQWKTIKDFSNYEVSDTGLVQRKTKNKPLATSTVKRKLTSYSKLTLFFKNKRYYKQVHRLVAQAFIPNPKDLPQVDHIDGNGLNNHVSNLRWVTRSENIKHAFYLHPVEKKKICSDGGKAGGKTIQRKAENKYKKMLEHRFIAFYPAGILCKDAAVEYICNCGQFRTANIMWKELRKHKGKCPVCTKTTRRSSQSLKRRHHVTP